MVYYASFVSKEAALAQLVEHILGKDEVVGSIPMGGSTFIGGTEGKNNSQEY